MLMKRLIWLGVLLAVLASSIVAQQTDELKPLYVTAHHGHFDAVSRAGVVLSEFETYAQLERYASDNGFRLVKR